MVEGYYSDKDTYEWYSTRAPIYTEIHIHIKFYIAADKNLRWIFLFFSSKFFFSCIGIELKWQKIYKTSIYILLCMLYLNLYFHIAIIIEVITSTLYIDYIMVSVRDILICAYINFPIFRTRYVSALHAVPVPYKKDCFNLKKKVIRCLNMIKSLMAT